MRFLIFWCMPIILFILSFLFYRKKTYGINLCYSILFLLTGILSAIGGIFAINGN